VPRRSADDSTARVVSRHVVRISAGDPWGNGW
jgi:hypothetical protein